MGAILVGTELVVTVFVCWFDIWAANSSFVSVEQKITLILLYSPWLIIPAIMVYDNIGRISKRIELSEKAKNM